MPPASTPQQLNPLTLPLHGSRLIEASAGTGKTWTISALYVRLVLGHGGPHACPRPLMPPDILVMTFTRAATRELSDRIRARLVQAAQWLRQADAGEPVAADPFMASLLASIEPGPARRDAAWRLAMAADAMDDAAVFTIDAWCQRVLREHAFDSGQLFDETLVADEQALRLQAVQDHWRQHVYPLTAQQFDLLRTCPTFKSVDALNKDLDTLLGEAGADASQPVEQAQALAAQPLWAVWQQAHARRTAALAALRAEWLPKAQAMQAWLAEQTSVYKKDWNGRRLGAATSAKWIESLVNWANATT
ncbi:MAG: UvrD-helicase domain-containing protein, partial [Burkholderiales bacterium]|nr:UvrD-helicase domain-containing protein [Burkholderiales bacterium]